jgi:hypothetical protein
MTESDPLASFPSLGDDFEAKLEALPSAPEPIVAQGMDIPECSFCYERAVYVLDKIHLVLKLMDGTIAVIETSPNKNVVYVCMKDKNSDRDEEVASAAHASIMMETLITSDLEEYDVYWNIL